MLSYLRENIQFLLLFALWILSGVLLGDAALAVVGGSMLLLSAKDYFAEILVGFWFILMLSDSSLSWFSFAQLTKKVLIVLLAVIVWLNRSRLFASPNQIFMLFLPFFLWSLFMVFRSPDAATALQKTLSYLLLFLVVPVLVDYASNKGLRHFLRLLIYSMTLYLLIGVVLRFLDPELVELAERFTGLMGNPNGLGLLVFLFAMLFDTACRKSAGLFSRGHRNMIWLVIVANLLFCQSRSSLFAFIIYLVFANFRALRGFLGLMAFVLLVVGYGFLVSNISEIIYGLGLDEVVRVENIEEASGRFIAWDFAWEEVLEEPTFGRGFNYTEILFKDNYYLLSPKGHEGNAHNSYLTFWLDTGIIGLVLFLVALFSLVFHVSKTNSNGSAVLYAVLFSAFFESWLTASLNPDTITLLMTFSLMMSVKDPVDTPPITEEQLAPV